MLQSLFLVIKSYWIGKTQSVIVDGYQSKKFLVSPVVLKGSVLGLVFIPHYNYKLPNIIFFIPSTFVCRCNQINPLFKSSIWKRRKLTLNFTIVSKNNKNNIWMCCSSNLVFFFVILSIPHTLKFPTITADTQFLKKITFFAPYKSSNWSKNWKFYGKYSSSKPEKIMSTGFLGTRHKRSW